jgi:MFS transporter, NNP family, nitrate/nitrite transporter
VVGAAGGLGGFFLPTVLGSLRGVEGTYAAGLLLFALVAAAAALALSRVKHSWRAEWARADLDVAF